MEWFKGGVGSAISSCRQSKSLFVVYIYDDSAATKTTDESWESSEVVTLMSARSYVALRLLKDSLECQQFSQLFPVFLYPSVFCIGMTGKVLVSMSGGQTHSQLALKLAEGFEKLQGELATPAQAPPSQAEATPLPEPPAPSLTVNTPTLVDVDSESSTAAQAPDSDEKVQRAKELIKQRRAEREEKEFEKEKGQELQRREAGRDVAKIKKLNEERQNQDWIRERQRQKEEAKKARDEVRAKLEQDKLERQARAAASQRERHASSPTTSPSPKSSFSTTGMCRIQLKLPVGGNFVVEMNRMDTLAMLRQRVAQELNASVDSVILMSTFPSKELTREFDEQTMIQLQLVPSGVIIIRMKKSFVSSLKSENGGGVWGFFTYVFQLIVWFLTFVKNAVAGLFGGGSSQERRKSTEHEPDIRRERLSALGGGSSHQENVGGPRMRKFRQEDYQDESDEERKQTYNGNSTQQQ